jgi:hypothetical protein
MKTDEMAPFILRRADHYGLMDMWENEAPSTANEFVFRP